MLQSKTRLGLIFCLTLFWATPAFADTTLPPPQQEGGMGLFEALKKRSSVPGGDFSMAEITDQELSTVLWAASGLNRGTTGWTVPMAHGEPPYCRIYVAGKNGVFLYDWATHSLKEVNKDDIRGKIGEQSFVKKAYYSLIIVSDGKALAQFKDDANQFRDVLAGAMTQDIYLTAAALNLGARYIHSMNREEIISALTLPEGDLPVCLMLLGK